MSLADFKTIIDQLNTTGKADPTVVRRFLSNRDSSSFHQLEAIFVASLGKPGHSLFTDYYPDYFTEWVHSFEFSYSFNTFPLKGDFDFGLAVQQIIDTKRQTGDSSEFYELFMALWVYHGTPAMYRAQYANSKARFDEVAEDEIEYFQQVNLAREIYWNASSTQLLRFDELGDGLERLDKFSWNQIQYRGAMAPAHIMKLMLAHSTIQTLTNILTTSKNKSLMLTGNMGDKTTALPPLKKYYDYLKTAVEFDQANDSELTKLWVAMVDSAKKEDDSGKNMKWVCESEPVTSLESKFSSGTFTSTDKIFLAGHPLVYSKVHPDDLPRVDQWLENMRSQTKTKITGSALALRDSLPPNVIVEIIMQSLPWERVWVGVDNKAEPGKMANRVESFILHVLKTNPNKRGREGRAEDEVENPRATKLVRTRAGVEKDDETKRIISKLKDFFKMEYPKEMSTSAKAGEMSYHNAIEAMKEILIDTPEGNVGPIISGWVRRAESERSEAKRTAMFQKIATAVSELKVQTCISKAKKQKLQKFETALIA